MKVKFETCELAKKYGYPQEGSSWFNIGNPCIKTFSSGSYKDYGDRYICRIELYDLLDWFRNIHKIHVIPMPITGSKNGYDSYPIIGWCCEILIPYENVNSYYMGYPVLDWFVMSRIEEGEKLEDYVSKFDTYEEALEDGLQTAFKHIKK